MQQDYMSDNTKKNYLKIRSKNVKIMNDTEKYNWIFALKCNQCQNIEYFLISNLWEAIMTIIKNKGRNSCAYCNKSYFYQEGE